MEREIIFKECIHDLFDNRDMFFEQVLEKLTDIYCNLSKDYTNIRSEILWSDGGIDFDCHSDEVPEFLVLTGQKKA